MMQKPDLANLPPELKEMFHAAKRMSETDRYCMVMTVVVGRIAVHGTTLSTEQIADFMKAGLTAIKLAAVLDFLTDNVGDGARTLPPKACLAIVRAYGEHERAKTLFLNLTEMAIAHEKPMKEPVA
jgi:hypothetical protein